MRPERRPPRVLDPRPALPQHPGHGRGQVVVPDLPGRDAAQDGERVHVAFQEGLLPAGRRHQVHGLAGIRHPEREQVALDQHPGQPHPQLPEVDLGLHARRVMLRDEHLRRAAALLDADLRPAPGHVIADGPVRHVPGPVLIQQPGVDPGRRVPLLARRVQVRPQPPVDHRLERLQPGRPPLRRLARVRLGVRQRFPHQPPVHPVLARQRPHRQAPVPRITPDQLEQLDLGGHHRSLLSPARTLTLPRQPPRWGHFKPTRPSRQQPPPRGGATSSRHGGANRSRHSQPAPLPCSSTRSTPPRPPCPAHHLPARPATWYLTPGAQPLPEIRWPHRVWCSARLSVQAGNGSVRSLPASAGVPSRRGRIQSCDLAAVFG